jgi:hypothetical protein
MPEEQLFTVHGKLAVEVLGGLADGTLSLSPGGGGGSGARTLRVSPAPPAAAAVAAPPLQVLEFALGSTESLVAEVLALLSSPRMRHMAKGGGGGGEVGGEADAEEVEGGEAVVASLAQAKTRLLAKLARKNVVENVVPICVALKAMLSAKKSPLVGPLMAYLSTLFADYGADVAGAFGGDLPPPPHTRPPLARTEHPPHTPPTPLTTLQTCCPRTSKRCASWSSTCGSSRRGKWTPLAAAVATRLCAAAPLLHRLPLRARSRPLRPHPRPRRRRRRRPQALPRAASAHLQ